MVATPPAPITGMPAFAARKTKSNASGKSDGP